MKSIYIWQYKTTLCITYTMILKKMEDFFLANGWTIAQQPEEADWILIGTCGSFENVIDAYFEHLDQFLESGANVAVYGCLPPITPGRYGPYRSRVAMTIPAEEPEQVEKILDQVNVKWQQLAEPAGFRRCDYRKWDPTRRYVLIQTGCNTHCVYCPHVIGIGPVVSVPKETILQQVQQCANDNIKTVFFEGREPGAWGVDLTPPQTFAQLVEKVLAVPGDFDIFLNQLSANWVFKYKQSLGPLLINPRIKDIHIAIQTTSDRLLQLMGRDPCVRELEGFLAKLKEEKKTILRTDLLIGFPTETEDELNDTLAFTAEYFDEAACYGLELHANTPLAKTRLPFFDRKEIERRVLYAQDYLQARGVIVHRGGQVTETLAQREQKKDQLMTVINNAN